MAEPSAPGSFIPHDTAAPVRRREGSGGLSDLVILIAIVLFVASAALAVGVFLYGQYLQSEKNSKLQQLDRAKAAIEPSLILQLTRLDERMHAASAILTNHIAPTVFFDALGQSTLQTVAFRTLSFDAADLKHMKIKMQGVAQSVNSIALQADLFSKNGVITSPIFSGINRQADGVHFDLTAAVNPAAINYSSLLQSAASQSDQSQSPPAQNPDDSSVFNGGQ